MQYVGAPRVAHRVGRFVASDHRRRGQLCTVVNPQSFTYRSGKAVQTNRATSSCCDLNSLKGILWQVFDDFEHPMAHERRQESESVFDSSLGQALLDKPVPIVTRMLTRDSVHSQRAVDIAKFVHCGLHRVNRSMTGLLTLPVLKQVGQGGLPGTALGQ